MSHSAHSREVAKEEMKNKNDFCVSFPPMAPVFLLSSKLCIFKVYLQLNAKTGQLFHKMYLSARLSLDTKNITIFCFYACSMDL